MSAALIAQLIVALGPTALNFIPQLAAVWNTPTLTIDQVNSLCAVAKTSYDQYRADAKASAGVTQ